MISSQINFICHLIVMKPIQVSFRQNKPLHFNVKLMGRLMLTFVVNFERSLSTQALENALAITSSYSIIPTLKPT